VVIAILSAPAAVRCSLGVGAWTTKRSALGSSILAADVRGEDRGGEWFSEDVRGEGVFLCPGTSSVSWWPDSYDGRGGGVLVGVKLTGTSAGSSIAVG
jgi:hypothetical protein